MSPSSPSNRNNNPLKSLLLVLALASTTHHLSAATFSWRDANSEVGGTTAWRQIGNYDAGGPGSYTFTNADELYFNATVARNVNFAGNGTIGTLRFGSNTATAAISGLTNTGILINLDGTTRQDAGIILEPGAGNINLNARFNLVGNVTLSNNSGLPNSTIEIGNSTNGGFEGTGNLTVTGGRTTLNKGIAANYANTGTTTINSSGTLQVSGGVVYTKSVITVDNTGTLSGGGTVGTTTVFSGGRISPGGDGGTAAGIGVLTFTNLLALQSGSQTVIDLKSAGADSIDATAGSVVLGGELRLRINATYASSGSYNLILGLNGSSGNFNSVTVRTGTDGTTAINLTDNGSGVWSGDFTPQNLQVVYNANTGILDVTLIPEPQVTTLSLVATTLLVLRRKRRNA